MWPHITKVNEIMPANGEEGMFTRPTLPRPMDIYIENTQNIHRFCDLWFRNDRNRLGETILIQIVRLSKQAIEFNHFFKQQYRN